MLKNERRVVMVWGEHHDGSALKGKMAPASVGGKPPPADYVELQTLRQNATPT
jgi:hypothetical protein